MSEHPPDPSAGPTERRPEEPGLGSDPPRQAPTPEPAAGESAAPGAATTAAAPDYGFAPPPASGPPVPAPPPAVEAPTAAYVRTDPPPAVPTAGVPARPNPLPPPRPPRPAPVPGSGNAPVAVPRPDPRAQRPGPAARPVTRGRKAKLVLKRVDPWSVFLYSVVASIFIGIALFLAVGFLYAVLSKLGVLESLNTLIGDVTREPGSTAPPPSVISASKVMTFAGLLAALDVVLLTALATLGAVLYNVGATLTGGIEVTLSDRD